jgi:hypothetical protein
MRRVSIGTLKPACALPVCPEQTPLIFTFVLVVLAVPTRMPALSGPSKTETELAPSRLLQSTAIPVKVGVPASELLGGSTRITSWDWAAAAELNARDTRATRPSASVRCATSVRNDIAVFSFFT